MATTTSGAAPGGPLLERGSEGIACELAAGHVERRQAQLVEEVGAPDVLVPPQSIPWYPGSTDAGEEIKVPLIKSMIDEKAWLQPESKPLTPT
jgi:hypothetical protein